MFCPLRDNNVHSVTGDYTRRYFSQKSVNSFLALPRLLIRHIQLSKCDGSKRFLLLILALKMIFFAPVFVRVIPEPLRYPSLSVSLVSYISREYSQGYTSRHIIVFTSQHWRKFATDSVRVV